MRSDVYVSYSYRWSWLLLIGLYQVGYIKSVIYALHRRVKGLKSLRDGQGDVLPSMNLDEAIMHLQERTKALNKGKLPTMKWVAETAMPKLHKEGEPTPSVYERDVLDANGAHMFSLMSQNW